MTGAKQITNGTQPLGVVIAKSDIYDTMMSVGGPEYMLEFPHGYTYSAHPVPCAAALASLDLLEQDQALSQVREAAPVLEKAVHTLGSLDTVVDVRNIGLAAGLTFAHHPGEPARRPYEVAMACLRRGFYVRYGGDTVQLAPPFSSSAQEIDALINALGESIQEVG